MRPIWYTTYEGGVWKLWPADYPEFTTAELDRMANQRKIAWTIVGTNDIFHALCFSVSFKSEDSPSIWDSVNGFRSTETELSESIDAVLAERGSRYGLFVNHAEITQSLKMQMHLTPNWNKLTSSQKESLEMIAHKIGRVLNGDPTYADSWIDIAGYAKLIGDELLGNIK